MHPQVVFAASPPEGCPHHLKTHTHKTRSTARVCHSPHLALAGAWLRPEVQHAQAQATPRRTQVKQRLPHDLHSILQQGGQQQWWWQEQRGGGGGGTGSAAQPLASVDAAEVPMAAGPTANHTYMQGKDTLLVGEVGWILLPFCPHTVHYPTATHNSPALPSPPFHQLTHPTHAPHTSASSRVTTSRSSQRARASASRTRLSSCRAVTGLLPAPAAALSARSCR